MRLDGDGDDRRWRRGRLRAASAYKFSCTRGLHVETSGPATLDLSRSSARRSRSSRPRRPHDAGRRPAQDVQDGRDRRARAAEVTSRTSRASRRSSRCSDAPGDRRPRRRAARARRRGALGARAVRAAAVHGPPAAAARSRTAPGHAWEQAVLPVLSARAPALLCPANLAPVAAPQRRGRDPRRRAAAPSRAGTRAPTPAFQRRMLPLIARRARAVITVSEFSRGELRGAARRGGAGRLRRRRPALRSPGAKAERPVRAVRRLATRRARTCARSCPPPRRWRATGVELRVAGGHRPQFAAEQRARTRCTLLGARPRRGAARRSTRAPRRSCCRRSTRASACPCSRRWRAGTPVVTTNVTALPETAGGAARLRRSGPEPCARLDSRGEASRRGCGRLLGRAGVTGAHGAG